MGRDERPVGNIPLSFKVVHDLKECLIFPYVVMKSVPHRTDIMQCITNGWRLPVSAFRKHMLLTFQRIKLHLLD